MKLSILIDSVLIVTSIALLPGIGGVQIATSNSGEPIAINSNNSSNVSYLKPSQYQTGNLTALNVVKTAVNPKKLPAQALNDKGYLNAVESHLTSYTTTNDLSY
ncbi:MULTISPECIES: hypothetical protein [unclassified Nostoc]|uniref:hypothetical protein n=1 Tax=unclassified Nostoc TaxID=2593658 RepID=UPI0025AA781C|nr:MULTISPECIES: hypothetical protein [unclassified Nostoc]MDM9585872.1 hypothetical protein [Nostoc sp. GT001]MDZ7943988.1 hypothetical protein [Nostoc sp. EfeVER01]MDZ7994004.1 hypothetical protein [Nostoc sp. EspVER01]